MISVEQAKAIIAAGLGDAEAKLCASFAAPLYWVIKESTGTVTTKNGTAFFLNAGNGPFGVTACHVIDTYKADCNVKDVVSLRLASPNGHSLPLIWKDRVIGSDPAIDIATFSITEEEVKLLEHVILTGHQKSWPPNPPLKDRGIYYCGFPGVGTMHLSLNDVSFGIVCGSGVASSISEKDISTLISRECLMPGLGDGIPPENFKFSGMSGGPMLRVTEGALRGWELAGVIYAGPNPSENRDESIPGLEIIRARRAYFILADGELNMTLWNSLNY